MGKKQDSYTGMTMGVGIGLATGAILGFVTDNLALWMCVGLALGISLGLVYDEKQKKKRRAPQVKVVDGASYTVMKRVSTAPGQRAHCWLGDNGAELELTDEEAVRYGLD